MLLQEDSWRKRGSSMVSALASRAKGTGIDPRLRQGNFLCPNTVSFRHDMKTVRRPSDWDVNLSPPPPPLVQGKSHPVQVKVPYGNSKWLLNVGLILQLGVYTCLECPRGRMAVYREKKK